MLQLLVYAEIEFIGSPIGDPSMVAGEVGGRSSYDANSSAGGVSKVPLVKEMVMSCSLARQKYMAFLENQRELKKKTEQQKRKREEVDDLKAGIHGSTSG